MKNVSVVLAATALLAVSSVSFAAPQVELSILGGQITAPSSFKGSNDNVDGASNDVDRVERELGLNSKHVSADFAPGLRLGVRLGDSPVIVQVGARKSDALDLSYDAGLRFNKKGSNFGAEARVVRFDESAVRDVFGGSVEGEAVVTYDVGALRLGAGVTTATLGDKAVNGLVTADLVFKFGGQSAEVVAPVVATPATPDVTATGERG